MSDKANIIETEKVDSYYEFYLYKTEFGSILFKEQDETWILLEVQ